VTLVNARFVKPIDEEMLDALQDTHEWFVTLEENVLSGGYGEKVMEYFTSRNLQKHILHIALPDAYVEHGNVDILKKEVGIDAASIYEQIKERM
jgi:1-deoxy-D-xylulose-5-phosphate synthase